MTDLQTTQDVVSFAEMAAAGRERVERLHDEAMQLIADFAEHWDEAEPAPAEPDDVPADDVAVAVETVDDDTVDDAAAGEEAGAQAEEPAANVAVHEDEDEAVAEPEEIRVLLPSELPALPPLPVHRNAARLATAVTDEFALPVEDAHHTVAA
ncbi:hypothetical protein [Modestobacter sp. SYSU DS0875]